MGQKVPFKFGEKVIGEEFKLEVFKATPKFFSEKFEAKSVGKIIQIPAASKIPKITTVELLYLDDTKGTILSFMEKLRAKENCVGLFGKELVFTLWEDDGEKSGHNSKNLFLDSKKAKINSKGFAVVEFTLCKALMHKAMQGEADAKQLEFYTTVEYFKNIKHVTENVNVNVKGVSIYTSKEETKPKLATKAEGSPAERKRASTKEEVGISETISKKWDELWDWAESKGTATPEKPPTVEKASRKSTGVVKDKKVEIKDGIIDDTCGVNYRANVQCVKYGKKNPKYGPVFFGSLKLANYSKWNILLASNKITAEEKEIIIGMSANEGNLDSVQSYDSEIVTVGAMQKTINPEGYGEFPIQMHEFKDEYPDRFKKLFENCGWDVKKIIVKVRKKEIIKWQAYYLDTTGSDLKTKIRDGFTANTYKKKVKCIPIEPLINAAKDPYFQAKQIQDFILRLRNKVLPSKPTGYEYQIKDYLISKLGKATALDQHINRPAYVKDDVGKALNNFFKEHPKASKNPNEWKDLHKQYETSILDDYGKNRRGTQMPTRYTQMKNSSHLK